MQTILIYRRIEFQSILKMHFCKLCKELDNRFNQNLLRIYKIWNQVIQCCQLHDIRRIFKYFIFNIIYSIFKIEQLIVNGAKRFEIFIHCLWRRLTTSNRVTRPLCTMQRARIQKIRLWILDLDVYSFGAILQNTIHEPRPQSQIALKGLKTDDFFGFEATVHVLYLKVF